MARQKLPQHKDDCIKCTLPEPNGVYHACMNCRNKAVEENKRLQIIIDDLERRLKQESNTKASLLADVNHCLYKEDYTKWRNKYFIHYEKIYNYKSIHSGEYFTTEQLHKKYEKAMLESPFK